MPLGTVNLYVGDEEGDRATAEAHYADHAEKPFFERACVFLCSGPLVCV